MDMKRISKFLFCIVAVILLVAYVYADGIKTDKVYKVDAVNCWNSNANVIFINTSAGQNISTFFSSKSSKPSASNYSNYYAIRVEMRSDGEYSVIQCGQAAVNTATQVDDGFILMVKKDYVASAGLTLPDAEWPEGASGDHTTPSGGNSASLTSISASITTEVDYTGNTLAYITFYPSNWSIDQATAAEREDDLDTADNDNIDVKLFKYSIDINKEPTYPTGVYYVRFNANSGSGSMSGQEITYNEPTALNVNSYSKSNYVFAGWSLTPDGDVDFIDGQTVVNLAPYGPIDVYAVWVQDSHTIYFDYNGGSGSPSSKVVVNGQEYGVLPTYPTMYEHLFTGWYTQPEGGERVYTTDIVDLDGDITLYAQWIYSPANEIIQDLVIKNNPDDDKDGVVDDIYLNFACSSYYEKFNVPLEGLITGQKYRLSFTESNNATFGNSETGYGNAIYGSIITTSPTLAAGSIKSESIADGGLIAQWSDVSKGDDWLNGPRDWSMEFTAEDSTMYWTWDMGLIQDGEKRDYNFINITLEPLPPEIEFNDYTLVDPDSYKANIVSWEYTDYSLDFEFDGNSGVEVIYYPITGLATGATYTITFNHNFDGALIGSNSDISQNTYDYGFGIMAEEPTKVASKMANIGTWISNTCVISPVPEDTESFELTFTAPSSTVYWVWNMGNVSDGTNANISIEITKIENDTGILYNSVEDNTEDYSLATLSDEAEVDFRDIAYYFAFRGRGTLGVNYPSPSVNADYDADGFVVEHATVERILSNGYPILDLTRNTLNEDRVDPGLSETTRDLGYLFGEIPDPEVTVYEPTNSILQMSNDWYYYDSKNNAVDYDIDNNVLRLRSYAERNLSTASAAATGKIYNDFLPFDYTDGVVIGTYKNGNSYNILTSDTSFWFGMTIDAKFYQPKDGIVNDEDMVFNFSGDDDVWVFVDDTLVLDLGGTHGVVEGSINFKTGEITQYLAWNGAKTTEGDRQYTTSLRECFDLAGTNPSGGWDESGEVFSDYSRHTFKMFYLERGAGTANCKLEFNIPILPKHSINVDKQISGDDAPQLGNPDFKFQILDNENNTKLADTEYKIYSIETGELISSDNKTDELGCFTLKSGQRATFDGLEANQGKFKVQELLNTELFDQYCTVTVDGTVYVTDLIQTDVIIGTEQFKGFVSPDKDISDGALYYVFGNAIDIEKYGWLEINKTIEDASISSDGYNPIFKVLVTLDNIELPVGTLYTIGDNSYYVEESGIIEIRNGETVIVPDIIAGSSYRVEEVTTDGYGVVYENQSGVISVKAGSNVTITNIPGVVLPNAGGTGNDLYYILGILVCTIAIGYKLHYKKCRI